MKKRLIFGMVCVMLVGSQGWADDTKEKTEKLPNSKEISQGMAEVWCQKMEECSQDKSMSKKECQGILFKSFKSGFDRLPKEQPLSLARETFEECKSSVAKGSCEDLKNAKTLSGCEFISRLGQ